MTAYTSNNGQPVETTLFRFIHAFQSQWGSEPTVVAITRAEQLELYRSRVQCFNASRPMVSFYDHELFVSEYAQEMRKVQLQIAPVQSSLTTHLECEYATSQEFAYQTLTRHLRSFVLTDTTSLSVVIECDPFSKLKRKLSKWFPSLAGKLKPTTKTFIIDGRILYPHLKVQMPNNPHTVKLALREGGAK